jgi:transcriptional regulator with XRE-family HTH domain
MPEGLDRDWFFGRLRMQKKSLRGLARFMGLDPSAVSRIVSGERALKASEQDAMAAFLEVTVDELATHRLGAWVQQGFAEPKQATLKPPAAASEDAEHKAPHRHPAWGALKGMITIPPGVDLTKPAYEHWEALYGEEK